MRRWTVIDTAEVPGSDTLTLLQGGDAFVIRAGGNDLMTSRLHGSEEALATVACGAPCDRVLVGGLGMGFTLRAALEVVAADAEITVAELYSAVVDWNRGPLAALASAPLDDPRVRVVVGDVLSLLNPSSGPWDAVLLDVDNGPEAFTTPTNRQLYTVAGLRRARGSLRKGGRLAVWSAFRDDDFAERLAKAGFSVETHRASAGRKSGSRHTIYVGTK